MRQRLQIMNLLPGQVLVMGAGHAQGQLNPTRKPADSVWSPSYKAEWTVLAG